MSASSSSTDVDYIRRVMEVKQKELDLRRKYVNEDKLIIERELQNRSNEILLESKFWLNVSIKEALTPENLEQYQNLCEWLYSPCFNIENPEILSGLAKQHNLKQQVTSCPVRPSVYSSKKTPPTTARQPVSMSSIHPKVQTLFPNTPITVSNKLHKVPNNFPLVPTGRLNKNMVRRNHEVTGIY
jgi:hypothetical protein